MALYFVSSLNPIAAGEGPDTHTVAVVVTTATRPWLCTYPDRTACHCSRNLRTDAHQATCGNLQQRGIGDIDVFTVSEYTALSPWRRLVYRLYRNPLVLLGVGPIYLFVIKHRLPLGLIRRHPRMLIGVMGTNLGIALVLTALGLGFGFRELLVVEGPIIVLSSAAGVWLFYVQHQFEQTYWRTESDWDFHEAAVMSSSYYDLPQPLRWLSGNIGLHHIHHLSLRVPNYHLARCLADIPALRTLNRIRLRDSFACLRLSLWDENAQRMISFRSLRRRSREAASPAAG